MKSSPIYRTTQTLIILLFALCLNAQTKDNETNKRIDDYLELLKLGYSEIEIFQDLGNVNFLTENYEAAAFWYEKLFQTAQVETIGKNYKERYDYARQYVANGTHINSKSKDWTQSIKEDYTLEKRNETQTSMAMNTIESEGSKDFNPSMSITQNGQVAFFSQAVYTKPDTGIFSKKELVHEIYRAERVNGQWKNFTKVKVCPKHYSAKHPTVSPDGTRLFFASNMPGTYGEYDIYMSEIKKDGSLGIAKNLGPKVNTKKNDLYPSLADGSLLFYASDGRKGYGGLDLFAVAVENNRVSRSINLGSAINSDHDDFSLSLIPEKGLGYVTTNRGPRKKVSQVAVTYSLKNDAEIVDKNEAELLKVLNDENETDYSSTLFEN
ncbi:cell envelope biogenesis protein OmpA [uncultured Croceitalea sp.]|uniref:cell envelope biogenesis protein OmpA n=1 Tax=uncultured Croceitalea sp. TaxID=1798908 RepID=UPI003305F457